MDGRLASKLRAAIGEALGAAVVGARALSGGSINAAWRVELGDGRSVFVKANADASPDMFAAEVRGLAWLGAGVRPGDRTQIDAQPTPAGPTLAGHGSQQFIRGKDRKAT